MKLMQQVAEAAKNAAQANEALNQAVVKGESTAAALQDLAGFIGAKKAQLALDAARKAVAERNEQQDKLKESAWGKVHTSKLLSE